MTDAEALDRIIAESHRRGFVEGYDAAIAALGAASDSVFYASCSHAGEGVGSVNLEACRCSILGLPLPDPPEEVSEGEDDEIPF
jgi:hypothetical protein